ncbi:transcription initiation factor TFIID subunit 1-like isoform X2 [Schistocerca piceifrons]|uniref:transcription initiation factor TFIID subunit 1-like isoform X2 n=1 Tax=Schistocerca piceifrons TaxID=274613 RepID=UPI001F5E61ED|nr:transcription initiation factor TFIID subunit 1-like isoform X2 [Schistocerca piceifrons]
MSKNSKKSRKNKHKAAPASAEQSSESVNDSMINGKSERILEDASGPSKNKDNTDKLTMEADAPEPKPGRILEAASGPSMNKDNIDKLTMEADPPEPKSGRILEDASGMSKNKDRSSEVLHANTDKQKMEAEPPEPNPEDLSQLKNTCRALKSNLNTINRKYQEEKKEKEMLLNENQDLKSKLCSVERELEAAKMQIEKLKNQGALPRKSCEAHEPMDHETVEEHASEQPDQKASSDGLMREKKEDYLVQNSAEGISEGPRETWDQDVEMDDSFNRWESGRAAKLPQGNDKDKESSWHQSDRKQWNDVAASVERDESLSSSQSSDHRGDTRSQNRRESYVGWKRNERSFYQPPNRNDEHGTRNFQNDRANRHDNTYRERGRGVDNRGDRGQNYNQNVNERGRGMDNRGDRGQNYNQNVNNCNIRDHRMRTTGEPQVVTETSGDLFTAPADYSLAHCVAEDMRMGSGIAVTFRQTFRRVDELLDQRKRQGQVAVLELDSRFIYYLVTKRESTGKPTMETLERSLVAMGQHVIENNVKKIAMPRIGCGRDRLEWRRVKPLIESIFSGTGAQIIVYNYDEDTAESSKPKHTSNVWLKSAQMPVADIDVGTAILCLCAADRSVNSTLELLDRKFRIMSQYQQMDRKLGKFIAIQKPNYYIFLLIVRESKSSPLSFRALGDCMRQVCKLIDKDRYEYVAVEAFDDEDDPLLFEKVITVIKTGLDTKYEKELWLCYPATVSRVPNTRPSSET